jgi:hypothetical protein
LPSIALPVLSEKDIAMSLVARENSSESEALKIATQAEGITTRRFTYYIKILMILFLKSGLLPGFVLLLKLKEMLLLFRN